MDQNLCYQCGGKITERNGTRMCPACGAFASVRLTNKAAALMDSAYRKLRLSKFYDAEQEFEDIICQYPQLAWGYWGRFLAKYYVKYETAGGKKAPVCYAVSKDSVYEDEDYQNALKFADKANAAVFKAHAEQIETFCAEWTDKVSREDPYDIFICYKESVNGTERTQDSVKAQALYEYLTEQGYRVFYGRESLSERGGKRFEPYLYVYGAVATAKVMVVYGTNSRYVTSSWTENEWSRYRKLMLAGEKAADSLLVVCDGFSYISLPEELADMTCLDAKSVSFHTDLTERISAILAEAAPEENAVLPQIMSVTENAAVPSAAPRAEDAAGPSGDLCQHVPQVIPGKAPTCQAAGWTESSFCQICGKTLQTLEWIPATDHVFGEWRTAKKPTCTKEGVEESVCACGEKKTRPIPATGHSFGEWKIAKKPTCSQEGEEESLCACGERKTKPIPATGHSFGEWRVAKKATCTRNGEEESVCACGERKTRPIPATGHSFGEWRVAKKATCTENGAYERVCACGKKETQTIPSRGGHITDGTWKTVRKAARGKDGLKAQTCIICGENVAEEVLPAIASEGLSYSVNYDKKTCTITGIGTCKDADLFIPPTIDGYEVTTIGRDAFKNLNTLKSVTLCDDIQSIEEWAFMGCSKLMNVTFPKKLLRIGLGAFWGCSSIKNIDIPSSVKTIHSHAFRYCRSLTSVSLPSSLETISSEMFESCEKLSSIKLPSMLTTIEDNAFKGCCSLGKVEIPVLLQSVGNSAFMNCTSLVSISMPNTLHTIGESAFEGCTALFDFSHAPFRTERVTSIGNRAFFGCRNLTYVTSKVSSIGAGAFSNCEKLNDFRMNAGLTEIGSKAFSGCKNLSSIRYDGTKAEWKKVKLDKEWRKESAIRSIECEGGTIKFLFS